MDDRERQQALIHQPVVKPQPILAAHRNQEIEIAIDLAALHPGAKTAFADVKRNIGKWGGNARIVEHRDDLGVAAEQALVQHARLARPAPENDFTHAE